MNKAAVQYTHIYTHTLLLLLRTTVTVNYFTFLIHSTTSASFFLTLPVSAVLVVRSCRVPARPGQEQNRVPRAVKHLQLQTKLHWELLFSPLLGGNWGVQLVISCSYKS